MSKELEAFKEIKLSLSNVSVDTNGELVYKLNPKRYLLCQIVEQALTKFDKIKTIIDTWNTSGIMSDEEALSQIDEVLRNE